MIALAILGDAESAQMPGWQADIETARHVFRNVYANNPLAHRCSEILELILPDNLPAPIAQDWETIQDVNLSSFMDFSAWPNDAGDFFTLFGWPESGPAA